MLRNIGKKISLAEHAYLVIKDSILNNELKPREILSEEALAEKLGISRTPLRTALKRLEFEKLVYVNSAKNTIVTDVDIKDIKDAFIVRCTVEPVCAKIACTKMSESDFLALDKIIAFQETVVQSSQLVDFMASDREFHILIAQLTDNALLEEIVEQLSIYSQRYVAATHQLDVYAPLALEEHKAIVAAFKVRDAKAAKDKMLYHIQQVAYRFFKN
jgi:DNA-binding GntR family transcriptional regulator